MLDKLKNSWNKLVAGGSVIFAAFKGFLAVPSYGIDEQSWYHYGAFFTALITGLWLVPIVRWSKRRYSGHWWIAATLFVILSVLTFFRYSSLLDRCTIVYWKDRRVVIGQTLTPDAQVFTNQQQGAGLPTDDLTLLQFYGGNPFAVWSSKEIEWCKRDLTLWYLGSIVALASSVLLVAQATYCVTKKN